MTTLSRLAAAGVWGCTLLSYRTQFLASCRYPRLFPVGVDPPEDATAFWQRANASLVQGIAWGKHPDYSNTTDEGCRGLALQALALQAIHGLGDTDAHMLGWLRRLDLDEIHAPLPGFPPFTDPQPSTNLGGWAQWPDGVRTELSAFAHVLTTARCYDDQSWLEIVIGLCLCIVSVEVRLGETVVLIESMAHTMLRNAMREALADADHAGGLGNFHDARTRDIMADRDHEPACVSTDATAGLVYGLLVAFAATGYGPYLQSAKVWRDRIKSMGVKLGDGTRIFYPFVRATSSFNDTWKSVGRDERFRIVPASQALWPVPGKAEYARGIPPSTAVPAVLARYDAGLKGLVTP